MITPATKTGSTRARATTTAAASRQSNAPTIGKTSSRPSTSAGPSSTTTATSVQTSRHGTPKRTTTSTSSAATGASTGTGTGSRHRGVSDARDTTTRGSSSAAAPSRRASVLPSGLRSERPLARDGTAQRHAKEVEGLKDYQLGHCLGRGAFGSVYSALNWSTGETVAIKQIRLSDMPKTELKVIMQEIDLLKNLHHPNIVKYHGFVKSSEALWIILEYCEQGSLYTICKNFGKFPENLVALYTAQVLQGLLFLHDQGVIHRDIKGANILTTKEGLVKLADFGVATRQQGLVAEGSVVGTPYWMAPEVIELAGATTASDIWSLGCTVIELLDGKPPYHKFAPMPALFRIVNDDHPPLPESCSPLVRDFLMQCFQKDPNLRVSAKKLLRHPWIVSAKKADTATKGEKKMEYDEAVKHVQNWNEALKSSPPTGAGAQSQRGAGVAGGAAGRRVGSRNATTTSSRAGSAATSAKPPPFRVATRRVSGAGTGAGRFRAGSSASSSETGGSSAAATTAKTTSSTTTTTTRGTASTSNPSDGAAEPRSSSSDDIWDGDFEESLSADLAALQLPTHRQPHDHFRGLFSSERLKQYANFDPIPEHHLHQHDSGSTNEQQQGRGTKVEMWDEDFEDDDGGLDCGELTVRSPLQLESSSLISGGDQQQQKLALHERKASKDSQPRTQILRAAALPQTKRQDAPATTATQQKKAVTAKGPTSATSAPIPAATKPANPTVSSTTTRWTECPTDEDYSDLIPEPADELAFRQKLTGFSPHSARSRDLLAAAASASAGSMRRVVSGGTAPGGRHRTQTPAAGAAAAAGGLLVHDAAAMRRTRSSLEIQKYAESEDDEDFGEGLVFDEARRGGAFGELKGAQQQTQDPAVMRQEEDSSSPSSAKSWAGSEESDCTVDHGVGPRKKEGSTHGAGVLPRPVNGGGAGLKLSNSLTWGDDGDDEEEEEDPFAQLEEELDDVDLELNVARDKHARLCTLVESLVGEIKLEMPEDDLVLLLDQLLDILDDAPTYAVAGAGGVAGGDIRNVIVFNHGMLPILEILEEAKRPDVILRLLRIVNRILDGSPDVQENLCFVGGIPVVTRFASRKFSTEIRLEAAAFVRMMYTAPQAPRAAALLLASAASPAAAALAAATSPAVGAPTMTLQMFVACGGLNVLVEFLEEDYDTPAGRELVLSGVNGIWSVFELQGSTPKNDFCRIFSRSAVLYPLSLVLNRVLDEEGDLARVTEARIVNIFLLFSQAENHVKETVADRMVLKRVLKDLRRMRPASQITMLKFIKNLSMLATTLDALQNSNAIEVLTDFLGTAMEQQQHAPAASRSSRAPAGAVGSTSNFREITNQLLNTMFNLCRLSKSRQEDAALSGLIPLLQRIVQTERPLKEFALPILCDMAHSGKVGRKVLWQNKGLAFYVELLKEPYWAVTALDALFVWLQEETGKVEECLLMDGGSGSGSFTEAIVNCFVEAKADAFENLLEPLQKMLRLSPAIAARLSASRAFFERAVGKVVVAKKALVRLNLLRVVRSIVDAAASVSSVNQLVLETGLLNTARRLHAEDPAILVREMAGELVRSCEQGELESKRVAAGLGTGNRRSSSSLHNPHGTPLSAISAGRGGAGSGYFDFQPSLLAGSSSGSAASGIHMATTGSGAMPPPHRRQTITPMLDHRAASSATDLPFFMSRSSSRASDVSECSSASSAAATSSSIGDFPVRPRPHSRQSLAGSGVHLGSLGPANVARSSARHSALGGARQHTAGRLSLAAPPPPPLSTFSSGSTNTSENGEVPPSLTPTHHAPPSANTRAAAQLAAQGRRKRGGGVA